jgi:ribosomal protein L30E
MIRGEITAVFVSSDCPPDMRAELDNYAGIKEIPVQVFPGNSKELSTICKKPFNITVISVVDKR